MFKGVVRDGEMRRWATWAGAALLLLLAVALETSMESVCWDENAVRAAKINEAAGCFEFWFSRYQTLIGALVALLAAFIAWIGIRRQLAISRQQTAIALLPLLDERYANANRLLVLAEEIEVGFEITRAAARVALNNGFHLRERIKAGEQFPLMFHNFEECVIDYKNKYEELTRSRIALIEEINRGFGGERIQNICKKMQISAAHICGRHSGKLSNLRMCVEHILGHRNLAAFNQIDEYVGSEFLLPNYHEAFPSAELREAVQEIQRERDHIFAFSRATV